MAHDVFISYAEKDKAVADAVCKALEKSGIRCWYAARDITGGIPFQEAIIDAISESRLMVLVLSSHSNGSLHVKREVENACNEQPQILILPFQIENVNLNNSLKYYISSVQRLSASNPPRKAHLHRLVNHVRTHLPSPEPVRVASDSDWLRVKGVARGMSDKQIALFVLTTAMEIVASIVLVLALQAVIGKSNINTRTVRLHPAGPLRNSLGMEFVYVPAGTFLMGSEKGEPNEKPVHMVTISNGFYLGRFEVTQEQWRKVLFNQSEFKGCDQCPVENVSWEEAKKFIAELERLPDGFSYRFPTEAEWEYACRAGWSTEFAFGDSLSAQQANFNSTGTMPVEKFPRNRWGLSGMHGNVSEWCMDNDHPNYNGAPSDGRTWVNNSDRDSRIIRGGSWSDSVEKLRSASRSGKKEDTTSPSIGLRLVAIPNKNQ